MKQLIECVPNFSEGRDMTIINQITGAIESVDGIKLLNVDPGRTTNRTVVTFVGEPHQVTEAAFRAIQKAAELIDMTQHKGEHPRIGATDVCPFIPVANISMEETIAWSLKLAERVGNQLCIPVYLYEESQPDKSRSNLSVIREGEYEGLFEKIKQSAWRPDFGPAELPPRHGATVIGARDFLIAYNVNLNTRSVKRANSVAFDIREAGRIKKDPETGKPLKDENGREIRIPGKLKGVKAIGWYIEEYGIAQVSVNITRLREAPLHRVFEECVESAHARGLRVTGSELVGLVPLSVMLDAGRYFLRKQRLSAGRSEKELIHIAVKSLGLNELKPFDPEKKIIEYMLQDNKQVRLVNQTVADFADETASESPAPGGGSVSALVGSLGACLATMVANLSAAKTGWEERWSEFSEWAEKGQQLKKQLLELVDEDTCAFHQLMNAYKIPGTTAEEKEVRNAAIQKATQQAIDVPFKVMQIALKSMEIIRAMAEKGNPASVSDAGVAALCACTAVRGAHLNVKINAASMKETNLFTELLRKAEEIEQQAMATEKEILAIVNKTICTT